MEWPQNVYPVLPDGPEGLAEGYDSKAKAIRAYPETEISTRRIFWQFSDECCISA
jgi:hypothetical protein